MKFFLVMISIILFIIIIVGMLCAGRKEHFYTVPSEYFCTFEDVPRIAFLETSARVHDINAASFLVTDQATYKLDPYINLNFVIVQTPQDMYAQCAILRKNNSLPSASVEVSTQDIALLDVLSRSTNIKLVPSDGPQDQILFHGDMDSERFRRILSNGHQVVDLTNMVDIHVLRALSENTLVLMPHSNVGVLGSPVVVAVRNEIIVENFDASVVVTQEDIPFTFVSRAPKCIKVDKSYIKNGDRVHVSTSRVLGLSGDYIATDNGVLCEAVTIPVQDCVGKCDEKYITGHISANNLKDGDTLFIDGCFSKVSSVGTKFSAVTVSCVDDNKNKVLFPEQYKCFGNDSIFSPDECRALGKEWSRQCVFDSECPYFRENLRGGCGADGICEMPVGVKNVGFKQGVGEPLCNGGACLGDLPRWAYA